MSCVHLRTDTADEWRYEASGKRQRHQPQRPVDARLADALQIDGDRRIAQVDFARFRRPASSAVAADAPVNVAQLGLQVVEELVERFADRRRRDGRHAGACRHEQRRCNGDGERDMPAHTG